MGGVGDVNSIESLSKMVRASLEKVPAAVRDQVLSSVITGMHSAPAWSTHAGMAPSAQAHAARRPQSLLQPMPAHMAPSAYGYMPMPNLMQQVHLHEHSHYSHEQKAATQSLQGCNQFSAHPMGGPHKTKQLAGTHAKEASGQLLPQASGQLLPQASPKYCDAASADATRNDESSDEEPVPASTPIWALPGQPLNSHVLNANALNAHALNAHALNVHTVSADA